MKRLLFLLVVLGGLYGPISNALIASGTQAIGSTNERMEKAGV